VGLSVGEAGVAAAGLAEGEGLSAAGAGRWHELHISTRAIADKTSFTDIKRRRHSFRSGSRPYCGRASLNNRTSSKSAREFKF